MEDKFLASVTVRLSMKILEQIDKVSGRGKKFTDKSAALRYYIERGMQFEALLTIYNNQEKRAEFEGKLGAIVKEKNMEELFETFDPEMLKSVILLAKTKLDSKYEQLMLEFK